MNWRRSAVGVVVALPIIAVLAFGLTRDPRAIESPLPGRDAPEFALAKLDGGDTVRLSELRGKVVVLNFWASWCLECRVEHADLSITASAYADRDVHFFGVLYNDTPANGRAWIQEMGGQTYPALIDQGSRTAIDYGLWGVPETFIIGRDGKVLEKRIGPFRSAGELAALLDSALALPATTAAGAQQ